MGVVVIKENSHKKNINRFVDWLIYMIGYAAILIAISVLFKKTIYIDPEYYGFWGLVAAIIIYILNKTIKPVLVWLTLPITGLTLGLFYPFINVFILNVVEFILQGHFEIKGVFMACIVACLISIMNALLENLVIEPLKRRNRL